MTFQPVMTKGVLALLVWGSAMTGMRSVAAQDTSPPTTMPALRQSLDKLGGLSVAPPSPGHSTPVPEHLQPGGRQTISLDELTRMENHPRVVAAPSAPEAKFFDTIGQIFDAQDSYWPFGTQTSVHIQAKTDDGVRRWVPFVSMAQDVDEVDAHIRNGIGAGVTYRFSKHARLDVEGMFLQHSGDVNPVLRDETRGMIVFSMDF